MPRCLNPKQFLWFDTSVPAGNFQPRGAADIGVVASPFILRYIESSILHNLAGRADGSLVIRGARLDFASRALRDHNHDVVSTS